MTGEPDGVPPGVDTKRANVARVYGYWLGGSHNFLADQDLGRAIAAVEPNVRAFARSGRDFLGRAVRFLGEAGYLVLGHATDESSKPAVAQAAERVYNRSVSTRIHVRSRAEILRFFDGLDLVEPGLVSPPLWRPDSPSGLSDPSQVWSLAGVARKP